MPDARQRSPLVEATDTMIDRAEAMCERYRRLLEDRQSPVAAGLVRNRLRRMELVASSLRASRSAPAIRRSAGNE